MTLRSGTRVHGTVKRRRVRPSGPSRFSLDVRAWCEKAKERMDVVVQKVSIDLLSSVIEKSPVGNPEFWAANAHAVYGRETHNLFVGRINAEADLFNAGLASQGESAFKGRRLIGAQKQTKRLGRKRLQQEYPLAAGQGYVGGRFKGNWQVSINSKPVGETARIDASGGATLSAGTAVSLGAKGGDVIFIQIMFRTPSNSSTDVRHKLRPAWCVSPWRASSRWSTRQSAMPRTKCHERRGT